MRHINLFFKVGISKEDTCLEQVSGLLIICMTL